MMEKKKLITALAMIIITMLSATGCTGGNVSNPVEEAMVSENSISGDAVVSADEIQQSELADDKDEKGNELSDYYYTYVCRMEDSIISEKGNILDVEVSLYDKTVHILGGEILYPELSDVLESENERWEAELAQLKENDGETDVFVDIQRADAYALSFVRNVRMVRGEERTVTYQGYHYDTETGRNITLSDIITDTEKYAESLADRLKSRYPQLADRDGLEEICETLLVQETPEWSMGYQGITFYFADETLEESSDEGYFIVYIPFAETEESVTADCMEHPADYAVSFETTARIEDTASTRQMQWEVCYDLDGDGSEEIISIEYTVNSIVVGEYQVEIRVNDEIYLFESNGEEVSDRGMPYLIFEDNSLAYVGLYIRGGIDGTGYIVMAEVSAEEIKPICREHLYLHNMRITNQNHILSCHMAWDYIENLRDGYCVSNEVFTREGLCPVSENEVDTFLPEQYVATAKEVELPLVDPDTMEKNGETVILKRGEALQLLWFCWNQYLDCVTATGEIVRIEYTGMDERGRWLLVNQGEDSLRDILQYLDYSESANLFGVMPSYYLYYSGVGGWSCEIDLESDGTFTGKCHDNDGNIRYICGFSGKFTMPQRVNDYIYTMNVESLELEEEPGVEVEDYYEDITLIYTEPFGFTDLGEFLIYLPGCPLKETGERFPFWLNVQIHSGANTIPERRYGIYNVNEDAGFIGYR